MGESGLEAATLLPGTRAKPSNTQVLVVLIAIALICLTTAVPDMRAWQPLMMLLIPATAAWTIRRQSLLVALYLLQVSIYYGLTGLLLGHERPPELVALVILWSAGVTLGGWLVRAKSRDQRTRMVTRRIWRPATWLQFILSCLLLGIHALLVFTGQLGYQAQLTLGQSTPTGTLGTLATATPIIILLFLVNALGSGLWIVPAVALALGEAIVFSVSGVRGAGVAFFIEVAILAALVLPVDSPWRRPRRVVIVGPVLASLVVFIFIAAAGVKNTASSEFRGSVQDSSLSNLDVILTRLDYGKPLEEAIVNSNNYGVQQAVNWSDQLTAGLPRFLWPEKPVVDYGQKVSVAVYGLKYGESSSFITIIGDTFVNLGTLGVAVGSVMLGLLLSALERRVRAGTGLPTFVLAAALAYSIMNSEATLIFFAITLIRTILVSAALWGMAGMIGAKRAIKQP